MEKLDCGKINDRFWLLLVDMRVLSEVLLSSFRTEQHESFFLCKIFNWSQARFAESEIAKL